MENYLPEKINVLGTEVPLVIENMEDAFAEWDLGACRIRVSPGIHEDYLRVTMIHEILHVIDDFLGIGIKHKDVYSISQSIFQVLRANPELARWLLDQND